MLFRSLGQHRSTQRKVPRGVDDKQALTEDIIALAKQYGRYGYIGMLVSETVVPIRREFAVGKAIKAIARDLHVSRKVIRKAVRAPEGAFDYRRKVQPHPRISHFEIESTPGLTFVR